MGNNAPPYFILKQYPHRWIGRGNAAPANWPARILDTTPIDCFIWGTLMYFRPIDTEDVFRRHIQTGIDT